MRRNLLELKEFRQPILLRPDAGGEVECVLDLQRALPSATTSSPVSLIP